MVRKGDAGHGPCGEMQVGRTGSYSQVEGAQAPQENAPAGRTGLATKDSREECSQNKTVRKVGDECAVLWV